MTMKEKTMKRDSRGRFTKEGEQNVLRPELNAPKEKPKHFAGERCNLPFYSDKTTQAEKNKIDYLEYTGEKRYFMLHEWVDCGIFVVFANNDVCIPSWILRPVMKQKFKDVLHPVRLSDFEVDKNGVKGLMQYDKAGDIKLKINGECIAWFIGEWTTKAKHLARFMGMQIAPAGLTDEVKK